MVFQVTPRISPEIQKSGQCSGNNQYNAKKQQQENITFTRKEQCKYQIGIRVVGINKE